MLKFTCLNRLKWAETNFEIREMNDEAFLQKRFFTERDCEGRRQFSPQFQFNLILPDPLNRGNCFLPDYKAPYSL